MKNLTAIIIILFNIQCADSERGNCRENLDSIELQKIMALSLLVPYSEYSDQENENRKNLGLVNFVYTQNKAEKRKRICDNNFFLKMFSPEANDFE